MFSWESGKAYHFPIFCIIFIDMKEITIDSSIWTLLKKDIGKHLDGAGNQKHDDLLIEIGDLVHNLPKKELIKRKLLEAEGKRKIECKLSIDEYREFLEECYNKLKYIKKFKEDHLETVSSLAIFFYHLDPSLVNRDKKEVEERKNIRNSVGLEHHDIDAGDLGDLSHKNNNYTTYQIKKDNEEIIFTRDTFKNNVLNMGNLPIFNFSSNNISHINIKNLPFKIKSDLDIHPSLYKKIIKKEFIEAQYNYRTEFHSDLHELYWSNNFDNIRDWIYDEKQNEFLKFSKEGKKIIKKIEDIHNNNMGSSAMFIGELQYRIIQDTINATHVLIEVYFKDINQFINEDKNINNSKNVIDHLEKIRKQKAGPEKLEEEFNKNRQKYKKIEEVLPLFPLTILIQKRRVEKISNTCPELFDTNIESLSFFE